MTLPQEGSIGPPSPSRKTLSTNQPAPSKAAKTAGQERSASLSNSSMSLALMPTSKNCLRTQACHIAPSFVEADASGRYHTATGDRGQGRAWTARAYDDPANQAALHASSPLGSCRASSKGNATATGTRCPRKGATSQPGRLPGASPTMGCSRRRRWKTVAWPKQNVSSSAISQGEGARSAEPASSDESTRTFGNKCLKTRSTRCTFKERMTTTRLDAYVAYNDVTASGSMQATTLRGEEPMTQLRPAPKAVPRRLINFACVCPARAQSARFPLNAKEACMRARAESWAMLAMPLNELDMEASSMK
mmetsp:Transcript_30089/g.82660  ORF Transcript_30089/g.82660 Transcript_30089/m.82660 type:complete len:306 (-) Transcript_30089:641-1558(-)